MPFHPAYRPDIDGLRAIAVLLVVGFHIFPEIVKGGFVGVDVFFVISGYLITTIILQNLAAGSFSLTEFYVRRVKRIFPALLLVLMATSVFAWLSLYSTELALFKKYLFGGAFFISNFVSWAESGYFDVSSTSKPLLHLWSLGIEEQFYIVWPLILICAAKQRVSLVLLIPLLLTASFFINICMVYGDAVAAFYSPVTRFWELLAGGFLASMRSASHARVKVRPALMHCLSCGGATLLVTAVLLVRKEDAFPGWWSLFPVAAAALIIAAGSSGFINKTILSNPILVWIGLISYPLYLWHWPLISFASIIFNGMPELTTRCVIVLISVALAWATYWFVERPIRGRAGFNGGARLTPALIGLMSGFGFLSAISYYGDAQVMQPNKSLEVAPVLPFGEKVFLLGDSHAEHLFAGLHKEFGARLINHAMPGCIPFYSLDTYNNDYKQGRCIAAANTIYTTLGEGQDSSVVVMGSMGPVYLTNTPFNGVGLRRVEGLQLQLESDKSITDRWQMYELAMRASFKRLLDSNKKVIFFIDVPELGMDPKYCIANQSAEKSADDVLIKRYTSDCKVDRAVFDERTQLYRDLVYRVMADFPEVTLFDPTDLFCDQRSCVGVKDDKVLYKDSDHLSEDGSDYVAKYLAPVIKAALD